jgi:hypothetical protein
VQLLMKLLNIWEMMNRRDDYIGKKIRIKQCWTIGHQYNKLFPKSIHTVISPKEHERNGDGGVWVQGITEPVKVHFDEFELYVPMSRTKK